MPKAIRPAPRHTQYRAAPTVIASDISEPSQENTYYPTLAMNMQPHSQLMSGHPQAYQTGGPVQPPTAMAQLHSQYPTANLQPAPMPVRASSGAWTPADDATLMAARAQGQNWAPIQAAYFPNKTPNACRKRHERLMERRNSDDWDVVKTERMAKEYMTLRKDMWTMLADRTGEKWAVVEGKCMTSGLKNLQSAARACARRDRLSGAYTDDSGIGLDDLDLDAEAEFSGSLDSSAFGQHQQQQQQHHHQQHHSSVAGAAASYSQHHRQHSGNVSYIPHQHQYGGHGQSSVSPEIDGGGYAMGARQAQAHHQAQQQYLMQGQRISSMGIPSIINRGV